jgi:DNA replication protein
MKRFQGFPARTEYTPIPGVFFGQLLPAIGDIDELKTTLHLFHWLYRKKGYPRFVTYHELASDVSLMSAITGDGKSPEEILRNALGKAVDRGTILHLSLNQGGTVEDVYLLNTEKDREAVSRVQSGEIGLPGIEGRIPVEAVIPEPQPNIYALYEENIGLLTPMIAEELKEAEKLYPEQWIKDAIKEAVKANKRRWRYIASILERWATEGKSDGAYRRDTKTADPDRFIKGRYGHLFQR